MLTKDDFLGLYRNDGFKFILYFVLVCLYLFLVCVFYAKYENWSFVDVVFFVIQTISTVGYGYPSPSDDYSRLFTISFIIIGIFVVLAGLNSFILNHAAQIKQWFGMEPITAIDETVTVEELYKSRLLTYRITFGFLILVVVSASILQAGENWSWIRALYFMVQTTAVSSIKSTFPFLQVIC